MQSAKFLIPALSLAALTAAHAQDALPLRHVVLFSSGVGYFQRVGRINGSADVNLSFRVEQINDILKSLVLIDPTGNVRPVTYGSRDAISRRLRNAGFTVNDQITIGALLRQFQGARVHLDTDAAAVDGRILSVSIKNAPVPLPVPIDAPAARADVVRPPYPYPYAPPQVEVLNLLTNEGLRAVPLDNVRQVRLLDDRLNRQLNESLEQLATGLDDTRRTVDLHFGGNTAREVRAGYLQEMPVWKTSYRLVLDAAAKPYLQGWAIVENTTDDDWKNVSLSLVSGRPISFIQDLYAPLYVSRPVVAAQVIGSPQPQQYAETLDEGAKADTRRKAAARGPVGAMGPAGPPGGGAGGANGLFLNSGTFAGNEGERSVREDLQRSTDGLAQSVVAQAQGTERGELFEYSIKQPVNLPRQQAAMVPIVSESVDGERLSIYSPAADPSHALNGFRLRNGTGLHLSGGPITVFQGGVYAGDAQIGNVQPGEERLVSYAVDLDLVVDRKETAAQQEVLAIAALHGVLQITRKQLHERFYSFRNKSATPKSVLVQQDLDPDFKLVQPAKASEQSPDSYRFRVPVAAKATAELKTVTERPVVEGVAMVSAELNLLLEFAHNAHVSPGLRAAIEQLVQRRRKIADLDQQKGLTDEQLKTIDQEQARIRQNMAQLDRNSALYQQYVKKFTDQEAQVERLRETSARLNDARTAAQQQLQTYVDGLTFA